MTRETKVGLLVGMGVILLIGIIVSDHLAVMQNEQREISDFADRAQNSIHDSIPDDTYRPSHREADSQRSAPSQHRETPSAGPRDQQRWTPDLEFGPDPRLQPAPDDRIADQRQRMPTAYALENTGRNDRTDIPSPPRDLNQREPRTLEFGSTQQLHEDEEFQRLADASGQSSASSFDALERESPQREPEPIVHRVQRGESLYDIARAYYGDGNYWRSIAEQNANRVTNGEHVREGVELIIPNRAGMARAQNQDLQNVADRASQAMRGQSAQREQTVTVERGDTLSDLASRHLGTSRRWRELLEANDDQLRSDRDLRAGMTLRLPTGGTATTSAGQRQAPAATRTYTIRNGDTLSRIAEQELGDRNRWRELFEANRGTLDSPDRLPVGKEIRIPS